MKKLVILVFLGLFYSGFAQTKCVTPNGEEAQCVSILDCAVLKEAFTNNVSKEAAEFLQESQCGYNKNPLVCCGSADGFTYNRDPKSHKNFGLLPSTCGQEFVTDKLLGGNQTLLDKYPWLALLEYRKNGKSTGHSCGGVLINDRYVLTAAYCVREDITVSAGKLFRVRLGEHDLRTDPDCEDFGDEQYCTEPRQDIEVEEVIVNPRYTRNGEYHNIALVRLAKPAVFKDNVQPICLPLNGEQSSPGDKLILAGWGRTPTKIMNDVKEGTTVSVVDLETCRNMYKNTTKFYLLDSQFCAQGQTELCKGNGGGPLVKPLPKSLSFYVEGIVSFGPSRCSPTWPDVYNKVSNYLIWILDNLKP